MSELIHKSNGMDSSNIYKYIYTVYIPMGFNSIVTKTRRPTPSNW